MPYKSSLCLCPSYYKVICVPSHVNSSTTILVSLTQREGVGEYSNIKLVIVERARPKNGKSKLAKDLDLEHLG